MASEQVCPICLQRIHNQVVLDCCKHTFCKRCIMAWMKRTPSCPLCKRSVGVIIADIVSPSQYSQFTPDGSLLYSNYDPKRKAVYALHLIPSPDYSGTISPAEVNKCALLKDWVEREVETLLPGMENGFVTTMIMEGLRRYGSRNSALEGRIRDVLGENGPVFLHEVEAFVHSRAKSLEEFDSIVLYSYPPHAENAKPLPISMDDEQYRTAYNELVKEYSSIEEELSALLGSDPALETLASDLSMRLEKTVWKEKTFVKPKPVREEKVRRVEYEDDADWDLYDY